MKRPKPLYSMLKLQDLTGVDRRTLHGIILGLGLQTYQVANGIVIDDDGFDRLILKLGIEDPRPVSV